MSQSNSGQFRDRLFAGVYLVVFFAAMLLGGLAARIPAVLIGAALAFPVLLLGFVIRRRIRNRPVSRDLSTVGELSRHELCAARSKLKRPR